MRDLRLTGAIQCPSCGRIAVVEMPTDACVRFWKCPSCSEIAQPETGDCCVFCSHGDTKCPPEQEKLQAL